MLTMKKGDVVLTFDRICDSVYIKIADRKIARTVEYSDEMNVDLDSSGRLVGIEILDPAKVRHHDLQVIARRYHQPFVKEIDHRAAMKVFAYA